MRHHLSCFIYNTYINNDNRPTICTVLSCDKNLALQHFQKTILGHTILAIVREKNVLQKFAVLGQFLKLFSPLKKINSFLCFILLRQLFAFSILYPSCCRVANQKPGGTTDMEKLSQGWKTRRFPSIDKTKHIDYRGVFNCYISKVPCM